MIQLTFVSCYLESFGHLTSSSSTVEVCWWLRLQKKCVLKVHAYVWIDKLDMHAWWWWWWWCVLPEEESTHRLRFFTVSRGCETCEETKHPSVPKRQLFQETTTSGQAASAVPASDTAIAPTNCSSLCSPDSRQAQLTTPTTFQLLAHQPWTGLLPISSLHYPAQRVDKHNLLHPAYFHLLPHQQYMGICCFKRFSLWLQTFQLSFMLAEFDRISTYQCSCM